MDFRRNEYGRNGQGRKAIIERLGQLIFTGIEGPELTVDEKKFLREENIGGVVLFSRNYENPVQLRDLADSVQALKTTHPFYIAVDHEGGRVIRFKRDFTQPPSMYDLARLDSLDIAARVARIMAWELYSCGINLNFSPVCDIWSNEKNQVIGDRAFGHDSKKVSPFVSVLVEEFQKNGILACAKHFPGHGCTLEDSHHELPVVNKKIEKLRESEFLPFREAVRAGVEFVMMAHIIIDDIDRQIPCSLSGKAHRMLREELKFEKLIISDDMQMKAVFDHYGVGEAAVAAVEAGSDIVEYRNMEESCRALEGLKKGLQDGKVNRATIDDRISRIARSKERYFSHKAPLERKSVGSGESRDFMKKVREKIATL